MEKPIANNVPVKPAAKAPISQNETSPSIPPSIAVVSEIKNGMASRITLHDTSYPVLACLSALPGLAQQMQLGDRVLISPVAGEAGVVILGFVMTASSPTLASLSLQNGKLVIEAQGALTLKSGTSTIELTAAGEIHIAGKKMRSVADSIRINGQNVRTVASDTLTLLGGNVNLN
jgi:hypothetical protein